MIQSAAKEMLGLPSDTPNSMLYFSNNLKGLGLPKARWEAFLQNYNSILILMRVNNEHIKHTQTLEEDIKFCLKSLSIPEEKLGENPSSRKLRKNLKETEIKTWCNLPQKEIGVQLFQEVTYVNNWVANHNDISSSEWVAAMKMNGNVAPVRGVPGRSQDGSRCSEYETLLHVLGFCSKGYVLRITRHNQSLIAESLRKMVFTVVEEMICNATNGSIRRFYI